ncbi:DUF4384 domain-containing protein [Meiothermus granaticius]|uniref:DUF4384 domain-containing protein n=1 Tax=Meiothermus granaticius NBRC 107808 TaxID=1227551 RepID=A0A399FCL3_9DEIN|nr:DUF4384 domain-containing protein [Meiothermus granaticius]MCL6526226.1 DUF4384 domain-containing protein [Thermaceae bacterium]RIH92431.1 hypothetical protein Mgrana_01727 [Meiothermus granaticius NBRC 107808]GEM87466.1 hypothetical protein MGR01S_20910 [Meiothermus granaticius NBRC 107808]
MRKLMLFLGLAGLLSACTVTTQGGARVNLRFGVDLTPTIIRLEPDRGPGSTYFVGEFVKFYLSLDRPGYVALVAIDPNGQTYEFSRYYLQAGSHLLSGPQGNPNFGFQLRPPRGLERVRAIYTDSPYPPGFTFSGVYTYETWDRQTSIYLRQTGARIRDVAETYFYIR